MRKVIASEATVKLGKLRLDELSPGVRDFLGTAQYVCTSSGVLNARLQLLIVHDLAVQDLTTKQNTAQLEHMVAGFSVRATPLSARIGIDHAADGGAV
ncbi:hypothetical protein FQZ97_582310 [compost metagenome]